MSNTADKVIIITGASSGIGEAVALALVNKGAKLVLGARRIENLEKIKAKAGDNSENVAIRRTDVTQREDVNQLAALALKTFGRIDVIINNAGLMPLSFISQKKVDEWERMVDVNIKGVLYGIASVIDTMREQKSGQIINVASIAGHTVFSTGAVYCATKHAVRAISEGIRQEEAFIRSTLISPGAVSTELTSTISDKRIAEATNAAYELALPVSAISDAILWAIEQPENVDVNEILVRPVSQKQ